MKPYLVLDTNIILLDANNIITLGKDYTLVIPETVLEELDAKKYSSDPNLRYQVREFFRIFTRKVRSEVIRKHNLIIIPSKLGDDIFIETVSKESYPKFATAENDSKIIHIAQQYAHMYDNVIFMTNDGGCGERAYALGLNVTDLKLVDNTSQEFTKELEIDPEIFPKLHNKQILDVDPDHKLENFNYVFKDSYTGQIKLGNIRNGFIDIIGKDTEQELRRQDISPKNIGQIFLSRAIQNPSIDIVLCEASAGTGFN